MKTILSLLPALVLIFVAAACGDSEQAPEASATEPAPAETEGATAATMHDGVQVVEITAGALGYRPQRIALKQGVPARLVFTRTADSACTEQVQSDDLDIEPTTLPMNEPVAIEFIPEQAGEYTFTCGMGMIHGTIVVRS